MFDPMRSRTGQPTAGAFTTSARPAALARLEDGLDKLCLSDIHAIEVEEISPVEFVREWGRAVTQAALAHAIEKHGDKTE